MTTKSPKDGSSQANTSGRSIARPAVLAVLCTMAVNEPELAFAAGENAATATTSDNVGPVPAIKTTRDGGEDRTFPDLKMTLENGVQFLPATQYWTPAGFRPLTMDLYLPTIAPNETRYPVIVFIHGGGWARGDSRSSRPIENFPGLLSQISKLGYVVASIDYRLTGEAIWPAQGQDLKAAIKFLRMKADRYGIDPARIATWGVSAGGHLSGIAASTAGVEQLKPQPLRENAVRTEDDVARSQVSDAVQAAVSWYGGFNMETIAEQSRKPGVFSRDDKRAPEWGVLGCFQNECSAERLRSASPVHYVDGKTAPMLLVVGDADVSIPHEQTLEMAEKMKVAKAEVELLVLPGADHDFAGKDAGETQKNNQIALDATLDFFHRTLYPH